MKASLKICFGLLGLILLAGCGNGEKNSDHQHEQSNSIVITNARARPAAEGTNSAAYLTIRNPTSRADTLVEVSGAAVSLAEVHESYQQDEMMGMRPADSLVIDAGGRLELKPGGFHIMLMQVKKQLISGDSLRLTLRFSEAGAREAVCVVQ